MTDVQSARNTGMSPPAGSSDLSDMTHASLDQLEAYYDRWSATYEEELLGMGYDAPQLAAEALHKLGIDGAQPVLDAGCGTGLTGLHLKERGFTTVTGVDYSTVSLEKAREKGCYSDLKRLNLNERLDFPDDHFAAAQCIGTLTYVKNVPGLMREFQRVVRPGGVVSFTHRVDLYDDAFENALKAIADDGLWSAVYHSKPQPYIPDHPDFGDDKAIIYDIFRVN